MAATNSLSISIIVAHPGAKDTMNIYILYVHIYIVYIYTFVQIYSCLTPTVYVFNHNYILLYILPALKFLLKGVTLF